MRIVPLTCVDLTVTVGAVGSNPRRARQEGDGCLLQQLLAISVLENEPSMSVSVLHGTLLHPCLRDRADVSSGKRYALAMFSTGDSGTSLDLSLSWEFQGLTKTPRLLPIYFSHSTAHAPSTNLVFCSSVSTSYAMATLL